MLNFPGLSHKYCSLVSKLEKEIITEDLTDDEKPSKIEELNKLLFDLKYGSKQHFEEWCELYGIN